MAVNSSGYALVGHKCLHRVLYEKTHGPQPGLVIDHKDGNRLNNDLSNLRPATKAQNAMNAKLSAANSCSAKGVHRVVLPSGAERWRASVWVGPKQHRKQFRTFDEAVAFATEQRTIHHGEFANHG